MQKSLFHLVLITYGRNPLLRVLVIRKRFLGLRKQSRCLYPWLVFQLENASILM